MLHEDKFDLMIHLHRPRFELYQLPFVCDQMTIDVQSFFWRYSLPDKRARGQGSWNHSVILSSDLSWRKYSHLPIYRAFRGKRKMHGKSGCTVNRETVFCQLNFAITVTI